MGEGVHTPTYWQTREVEFDRKDWLLLHPHKGPMTAITPQFGSDVVAIVWGENDAQEAANAALIVRSVNSLPALVAALEALAATYADLANSGDAGFWDPENVPEMIAARAALKLGRGEQ